MSAVPGDGSLTLADQADQKAPRRAKTAERGGASLLGTMRSRFGLTALSLAVSLLLTPLALATLAGGAFYLADPAATDPVTVTAALVAILAPGVLLGGVAAMSGASVTGPVVAGGLFAVAPGVAFLVWPDTAAAWVRGTLEPDAAGSGEAIVAGIEWLGRSGSLLLLGVTLVLIGVAAGLASRNPYPRRVAPAFATGLLLTPVGVVLASIGSAQLLASPERTAATTPFLWVGTALLAVVVVSAGASTSGLITGAVLCGVVPGLLGVFLPEWSREITGGLADGASELIGGLPETELPGFVPPDSLAGLGDTTWLGELAGLHDLIRHGVLLAWGATGALGALGVQAARRAGRRRQLEKHSGPGASRLKV